MKCPKCGYLGFETTDRCRNCGYDFSLAIPGRTPTELPLHTASDEGSPLADFDLGGPGVRDDGHSDSSVDLDRIIGASAASPVTAARSMSEALPLFPPEAADDTPLITTPRPPRAPLAVRRTTPDRVRARVLTPPPQEALGIAAFELLDQAEAAHNRESAAVETLALRAAAHQPRLVAALIDLVLLTVVDGIVVYLTLALAGLGLDAIARVPLAPLLGFLAILDGGYLVAFVAASGQTIGKMVTGIRVMGDDGCRVDLGDAVLRAVGCGISALTAGLGYLPAFVAADGRALQDRIAGTRVVSAR